MESIKEYLVSLGFSVDNVSLRRFEDGLKRASVNTEKFAKNVVGDFAVVGAAVVTAFTAVGAGTIGLMSHVAKADLGYQMFARRMFMGVDAAKKMKIATDALGVSLEEIVWGPPELAERYRALVKDQTEMMKFLGGDKFEKSMRSIRDIGFQFTRMVPELQYFSMRFTEDIMNKLFGTPKSLENRLKDFNAWFIANMPRISDEISSVIAPAFKKLAGAAESLFTKKNVDWVVNIVTKGADNLGMLFNWLQSDNKWGLLWDKDKNTNSNMNTMLGLDKDQVIGKVAGVAKKYGGPEAIAEFLALIQQESGFNSNARNNRTGAMGLGQVMPFNSQGKDLSDPDQNLAVAAQMFFGARARHSGSVEEALHDYYGHGKPGPGEPTFDQYYQQYVEKYNKWRGDPLANPNGGNLQNQAMHTTIDVGGIHINQPNATPDQIKRAVKDGIDEATKKANQRAMATRQGAYA
jgi:hypothetical protein